jgi:antitoxin ParD1/3/4
MESRIVPLALATHMQVLTPIFSWQELTDHAISCRITIGGFAMNMTSMNISLPEPLKLFVEEQVNKGGYSTASEYLRELIREAQRRKEHQELEAKLLAGLQSPTSEMTAEEWTTLRERILSRSPELRGEG